MRNVVMLVVLTLLSAPALAIYKCEAEGKVSYSDAPCRDGKSRRLEDATWDMPLAPDVENAKNRAAREKTEVKRIEKARQLDDAQEEKHRQKLAQAGADKRKKCAELALQLKWAEEDARVAAGKSAEKAKRTAHRKSEKFQMECGK